MKEKGRRSNHNEGHPGDVDLLRVRVRFFEKFKWLHGIMVSPPVLDWDPRVSELFTTSQE
jgi:hypothetical protein